MDVVGYTHGPTLPSVAQGNFTLCQHMELHAKMARPVPITSSPIHSAQNTPLPQPISEGLKLHRQS